MNCTVLYLCFLSYCISSSISIFYHIISLPFVLKHATQQKDVAVWETPQTIWTAPPFFVHREEMRGFPTTFLSFKWASSNRSLIWKLPSLSFIGNLFQALWKAKCYCGFILTFYSPSYLLPSFYLWMDSVWSMYFVSICLYELEINTHRLYLIYKHLFSKRFIILRH